MKTITLTLIVLFAGCLTDVSNAQTEQCRTETNALLNKTTSTEIDPFDPCYDQFIQGDYDCSVDASQYAGEFKDVCEDLGGQHFVGDLQVKCEASNFTQGMPFTWNILNYNACLGPSCTESDVPLMIEEANQEVNSQGLGISCEISADIGSTPNTTTSPEIPTMEPSAGSNDGKPSTNAPGPTTLSPSSDSNAHTTNRVLLLASFGAAVWLMVLA